MNSCPTLGNLIWHSQNFEMNLCISTNISPKTLTVTNDMIQSNYMLRLLSNLDLINIYIHIFFYINVYCIDSKNAFIINDTKLA